MKLFLIILLLILLVIFFICEKCLQLITHPYRYSLEQMRQYEIDNGFKQAIDNYENKWKRREFIVECDKASISGELIKNPDAEKDKVAIIAHGHTANRYASLKYADIFYRNGYNIIIYDERYFGHSTGDYCTLGEKECDDLLEIIDYAKQVFGEDARIALHGESMGAATVLMSLKSYNPELVIADCPFCDSTRLFREYIKANLHIPSFFIIPFLLPLAVLQYGYHIKKVSPIEAVKNSDVPICFMHGTADTLIDADHSKKMYELCKNPKSELNLFDGAKHAYSIVCDSNRYEKLMVDFINKCTE